jgi:hypothetical protein
MELLYLARLGLSFSRLMSALPQISTGVQCGGKSLVISKLDVYLGR